MSGRRVLAGAFAAAALLVLAPSSGATIVDRGTYSDDYSFSYECDGFDVNVEGTQSGRFRIRAGKGKLDRAFFAHDNFTFTETHTNAETGEFITLTVDAVFNEVKAVPLGGNLFEFWAVEAGKAFLYDSDGNLIARDHGSIRRHAIFDVGDDDEPGGILVSEFEPVLHGPHPVFEMDFCALLAA